MSKWNQMEWQGKQDTLPRAECTMQEGLRIRHSRNLSRCSINADVQPLELFELDAELHMESQGKHDSWQKADCTMQAGLRIRHSRNTSRCSINSDVQPSELDAEPQMESQGKQDSPRADCTMPEVHRIRHDTSPRGRDDAHACKVETPVQEAAGGKAKRSWCTQFVRPGRSRDMLLLMTITLFLNLDQNLMAPNLSDIARDFNMTDTERDTKLGGEISLSMFIIGVPASLILGYYADRVNRKNLYTATIFFGAVGCFLTYWVKEYWQLLILRAMTGVSLGGSGPLVASMIGDMYPPKDRPRANMYAGVASSMGVGLGSLLAAMTGGSSSGWRLSFVIIGAPSFLIIIAFHYFVNEPIRGAQEATYAEPSWETADGENTRDDTHLKRDSAALNADIHGCELSEIHVLKAPSSPRAPTLAHHSLEEGSAGVDDGARGEPAARTAGVDGVGVALVVEGLGLSTLAGRVIRHSRGMSWSSINSLSSVRSAMLGEDTADSVAACDPFRSLCTSSNAGDVPPCPVRLADTGGPGADTGGVGEGSRCCRSRAPLQHSAHNSLQGRDTDTSSGLWEFVRLFRVKSNLILYIQGVLACMPWGVINIYLADYLLQDRQAHADYLPPKLAAWAVCGALGVGTLAGSVIGGEVGSRIYVWKKHCIAYLLGTCQILAIGPMLLLLNLPFQLEALVPIAFCGGLLAMISAPNQRAIMLNVNAPNTRGTAAAVFGITDEIGKGCGPPLVALLIAAYGRRSAFSITFSMWFLNGLILMLLRFTLEADEEHVAQVVSEQLRSRMDAHSNAQSLDAQWAINEGNKIESTDKTIQMVCALENSFRENMGKESESTYSSIRSTNSRTPMLSAV